MTGKLIIFLVGILLSLCLSRVVQGRTFFLYFIGNRIRKVGYMNGQDIGLIKESVKIPFYCEAQYLTF